MNYHKQENGPFSIYDSGSFPRMKLSEAIDEFKLMANVDNRAESTLELYDYVFNRFTDFLSEKVQIDSISTKQIRKYLAKLIDEELKRTTVAIHHRVLNAFFTWLVKERFLKESPTKKVDKPKTPNKYPKVLNKEQVNKLIEAARKRKDSWTGYRNYTILLLFIDTGIRRKELIEAKVDDLDLKRHSLKVHGKGAKDRKVYFGLTTLRTLRRWMGIRDNIEQVWDNAIFISTEGTRLKTRNLQRRISVIQKNAGLEDVQVSPHVFRHTSATMAVENGLDPFSLKHQFGWEKIETAMRYLHLSDHNLEKSYRKRSPLEGFMKR